MSAIRARYDGSSGTGVDVTVELDTGEFRNVHVKQGGLLPESIGDTPISAAFRDGLLEQEGWSKYKQPVQSSSTTDDKKEG